MAASQTARSRGAWIKCSANGGRTKAQQNLGSLGLAPISGSPRECLCVSMYKADCERPSYLGYDLAFGMPLVFARVIVGLKVIGTLFAVEEAYPRVVSN